ncbi:MAG: hypothetical protein LQ350_001059 [Teloschistes chrysophthalmus]|nr:MAG: hypothetical protein LQ350_001059 [Niorma chrysophthalma]
MDAPRLLVLIFLLLILFASPETRTVSPAQQRELDHLILRERYALSLLNTSQYGDLDTARDRWINATGLRKHDGYAWHLLPRVQERAKQQASTVITTWHASMANREDAILDENTTSSNATVTERDTESYPPLYQNITGIVNGYWVRSKVASGTRAPILNLTTLVPGVNYVTDQYTRNVTGTEGRIRIRLDEEKSKVLDIQNTMVREITAVLTLQDEFSSGDGWEMTLHGTHFPREGSVVLTTTSQRFAGIFALPHLTLSPTSFSKSRHFLETTLSETIKIQESASETNTFSPWSSSPHSSSDLLFPTPHCEYIVYLQQHPIDTLSSDVESIEAELRQPTGRLDLPSPALKLSALIFSPDCGFILESKGPPDYAPQYGSHLRGPKLESYVRSGRRAILAFAVVVCAEISLLFRQMREASTPSTRSRISFYTIGMMAMGDGFVCMSFLVISILLDAAFLPLVATAFLAFLCVSFFGMKFLMDIWTVQAPEREERQRERERRRAIANPASAASTPARASLITAASGDTLPLPVTAPRPNPSNGAAQAEQDAQPSEVGAQASTNPVPNPPAVTPDPANAARRELSALYTRFYLLLVVILFLTAYSTTWPLALRKFYVHVLSLSYLSFLLPQIHRNIMRNCRKALQWHFVVGQSVLRTCPFFYFYLYTDNILFAEYDSNWVVALVGWVWLQVWILASQELFGPRFLVPKACNRWLPAAYDYHPILREEDIESGLSMPIGFTPATASFSTAAPNPSPSDKEPSGGDRVDQQKGKLTFDCAICMQSFDAPVIARGAEGGSLSATTAGIGAGVKDLVFGRRAYMVFVKLLSYLFSTSLKMFWAVIRIVPLIIVSVQSLNIPAANRSSSAPGLLRMPSNDLPNPYHISNSDLFLDFLDHNEGPVYSRACIAALLDRARDDVIFLMRRHGDTEISPGSHQSKYAGLTFVYESRPPNRIMKYSEVLTVIRGMKAKERLDGNRHRLATVLYEDVLGYHNEIGDVALLSVAPGKASAD